MRRREVLKAFAAGTVSALLPIAGWRARAQPARHKIRVNKIPVSDYVTVDLALSNGWFADEGLDVSIETVAVGAVALQALVAGKLDIIWTSLDNCIKARAQGFDLVIVSGMVRVQQKPPGAVAILVKKNGGIANARDLEGKRLLVGNLQGIDWAYSRELVAKAGGDPNKVRFLEVPFPQMVDSLMAGQADAASTSEPFTTIGLGTGQLAALSYPFVELQPGLNVAGWCAQGNWVRNNAQAVSAFQHVLQKTIDFLEQNPKEKTNAILRFTSLKPDLLNRITLNEWSTQVDRADLQKQVEVYLRQGMIDKPVDVATLLL